MKIHLIGICGTGMGSLAGLLKAAGHDVRGSDEHVYPPMSTQLAEQGIAVFDGFRPENLDWGPERVVVGNVCRKDHVEVVAAAERAAQARFVSVAAGGAVPAATSTRWSSPARTARPPPRRSWRTC